MNKLRALFDVIFNAMTIGLAILAGLGMLLARGISERSPVAYVVLGGIVFMVMAGMGAVFVLFVQWISDRRAERTARIEQDRFQANAKENLALMQATARVQATQNSMLLRQAREAQRALPAPDGDIIDIDALVADDSIFDDLLEA